MGLPAHLQLEFDDSAHQLTVHATGELDAESGEMLFRSAMEHLPKDSVRVWLDLSGVTFCDSSGLYALLTLRSDAAKIGADTVVYAPGPAMYRLLQMTHLVDHFQVVAPPDEGTSSS